MLIQGCQILYSSKLLHQLFSLFGSEDVWVCTHSVLIVSAIQTDSNIGMERFQSFMGYDFFPYCRLDRHFKELLRDDFIWVMHQKFGHLNYLPW